MEKIVFTRDYPVIVLKGEEPVFRSGDVVEPYRKYMNMHVMAYGVEGADGRRWLVLDDRDVKLHV
jgi:hypothetical protein